MAHSALIACVSTVALKRVVVLAADSTVFTRVGIATILHGARPVDDAVVSTARNLVNHFTLDVDISHAAQESGFATVSVPT